MGLKPDEQNEEQAPGEGSNRAARLGFIVLVQAHYWQGLGACGEATLRNLTAENQGHKRRPFGRWDGINRGQRDEQQGSRLTGLSDGPSQASSSAGHTEGLQQASGHHLDPTGDGGHRSRGQAASLSRTRCHSPRRRRENPPTRAQGCGSAAHAQPLRRVTRSHCRRRGLRGAQLRSDTTPTRQRSHWRQDAKLTSTGVRPQGRHGAGPPLPSAALPRRGDRGLGLARSGCVPLQP